MRLIQLLATALVLSAVGVVQLLVGFDAQGQEIPRDEYLRYLPLEYPTIVRQTEASVEMNLFGDITDPNQDVDPVDGINDHRHKVLLALAERFAPYLVLNSTMIPMDFRLFMEREEAFLLFVDTWNVSRNPPEFVSSETINWQALAHSTSEVRSPVPDADTSDERLRSLLKAFDPFAPGAAYHPGAVAPEGVKHQVMFFDFPGDGEETWKQEYVNQISGALPQLYEGAAKVFVHPFVESVRSSATGHPGYAFVLQYWFFYPYNDGVNNHEGDWEHINVSITLRDELHTPRDELHEPLSETDVRRILAGTALDSLVIQRVEYYFHHKVMTLDYTRPNVYQSRKDWERDLKNIREERFGEKWIWEQIRYRAYWDDDEKEINTHPIGFIGGDNRGTDQLLEHPGNSNRASNGTYPFSGLYKNVGQVEAAEQISHRFDHRKDLAAGDHKRGIPKGGYRRGRMVGFASPDRIEILPDGERVVNLVKTNVQARRDWAWLVLPIRWGYPATESPFAGAIAYTDLGNSSVLGPSYNAGWNRSGDALRFQVYSPHTFGPLLPLTWRDSFANNRGYLNLPLSLLAALPPFDVSWRVISLPFRSFLGMPDRIFRPDGPIPYRFLSIDIFGVMRRIEHWHIAKLVLNPIQMDVITDYLDDVGRQYGPFIFSEDLSFENFQAFRGEIALYLGERFASQNALYVESSNIYYDLTFQSIDGSEIPETFQLRGNLIYYEYSGSLRYNLTTGSLMVFLKGGYDRRWYRLKNISDNNGPFPDPNSPWVSKPTLKDLSTFLPNTLYFGGGIEWVPVRNIGVLSSGIDVGILGELLVYRAHFRIGLDTLLPAVSRITTNGTSVTSPYITTQGVFRLTLRVGF